MINNFSSPKHYLILFLIIVVLAAFLRFYKLSSNPPGLYWDETVFGYDAYSILKTCKDHHGKFLPLFFESFGDWKLPGYHYLLIPSIAVFGLNEFAVRFPSAFFGTLTVVLTYFLAKQLFQLKTGNRKSKARNQEIIALFAAFFLAISPWHIQFSRGGFESTVGLFFVTLGVWLFLLAINNQKTSYFIFSFLLFGLSMYTYHAYRIFTPFLVSLFLITFADKIRQSLRKILISLIVAFVFLWPLISFSFTAQGRFRAISQGAFKKSDYETNRVDYDQNSKRPLRFLSKYWPQSIYIPYQAFNSYIEHFSPVFLFFKGDQTGRHSQVDMGQIYIFDGLLIIFAIFALKDVGNKSKRLIIGWLLLAPIPATIVTPVPHAYRTLQMVIPLAFLSAIGALYFFSQNRWLIPKILLSVVILYSFLTYTHLLFVHYPKKFAPDWQDGYKQMVRTVAKYQGNYQKVYVTNILQVPYIYFLFHQKYDPQKFIDEKGNRDAFDKYVFIDDNNYSVNSVISDKKLKILYIAPHWKKVDGDWVAAVNDSRVNHIFSLWDISKKKND